MGTGASRAPAGVVRGAGSISVVVESFAINMKKLGVCLSFYKTKIVLREVIASTRKKPWRADAWSSSSWMRLGGGGVGGGGGDEVAFADGVGEVVFAGDGVGEGLGAPGITVWQLDP